MNIRSAEFLRGIRGSDALLSDGTPQIAFIGRSNVGKSSLLNALTERKQLARVGKKPGKTTEINIYRVNDTHYFLDLPGYGFADATPAEREKLRKLIIWYFTSGEAHPALTVFALEAKAGLTRFDEDMLKILREHGLPHVIVLNKVDKLSQKELAQKLRDIKERSGELVVMQTSAESGRGISALRERILTV